MALGLAAGGKREAAVAHHHAGHTVPARAGPERIPEDLRVHVGVSVHEARRHHLAVGVEDLTRGLTNAADGRDASVSHRDIAPIAGEAGSVDHRAVLDQQVVGHRPGLLTNGARAASIWCAYRTSAGCPS